MPRLSSLLLLVVLCLLYSEGTRERRVSNVTDPKCPPRKRNMAALTGQTCQRPCERRGCAKSRTCVCDGECGMSCIQSGLSCPWPVTFENAEANLAQDSSRFGGFMEVMCNPGFRMANGQEAATSRCQGDGRWSFTAPCEDALNHSSLCKPPPEIENGFHEDGPYKTGNEVHYWCDYGYQLKGPDTLLCQENQEWSPVTPACQPVYCSRPANVAEATLVAVHQSEYPVGTVIYYLCNKDFYLDGSNRVVCQENGTWSQLPYCRARCPILAKRSRIIYQKHKLWFYEIPEGLVHHGESVTFFCRSQNKTCSFRAESQCFDGQLELPDCYDEPTYLQYYLFPKRVVSEIPTC
ncbi:beta-2-glycoprotein 1-like [Hemicordylus capensis]|uniref:beta-2-glycoprotein 1-like n=1 Tax=Hemicordylus capensis TaxID=884348 RepID=UPI00230346ED|nr:beta-2-glycoprotein 1-like [Hemicordylus capensis]